MIKDPEDNCPLTSLTSLPIDLNRNEIMFETLINNI